MSVVAALRDASWFNRPDVYTPKRYHVAIDTGRRVTTSSYQDIPVLVAACNPEMRPLIYEWGTLDANEVPVSLRCQANGCRQRWPA